MRNYKYTIYEWKIFEKNKHTKLKKVNKDGSLHEICEDSP